jgi:WD repeat-containing protein 35
LFTKTLAKIQNETVKKAEVAAWFKNFDEAEKLYLEADMRLLAVRMRKRLGDWFKVVQLLKTGSGGNDTEMEEAYNEVIPMHCI